MAKKLINDQPTAGPTQKVKSARRNMSTKRAAKKLAKDLTTMRMGNSKLFGKDVVTQMGNTLPGASWALKCLDPCVERYNDVVRIPDGATEKSVGLARRNVYVLGAPTSAITASANWKSQVWHLPFVNLRAVVFRWLASAAVSDEDLYGVATQLLEQANQDNNQYPNFATYMTVGPPAVAVECSVLVSSVLTPKFYDTANPDVPNNGKGYDYITDTARYIRRGNYGCTTQLISSRLYDEGFVSVGQWTAGVVTTDLREFPEGGNQVPHPIYVVDIPPTDSARIYQDDQNAYISEARAGSYSPCRPVMNDLTFTPTTEARPVALAKHVSFGDLTYPDVPTDLHLRGWDLMVEFYEDIDYRASLRLKISEDLEIVVGDKSDYAAMIQTAPCEDQRALSFVKEYVRHEPHSYPMSFNELGKLLRQILSGVGGVVSNLGLPVISMGADWVKKFADSSVGEYLAGLLD